MRKLVIVLVMLMAAGMVFASSYSGNSTADSLTDEKLATLKVTLPLKTDEFSSVIVGFASNELTINNTVETFTKEISVLTEDIELIPKANGGGAEYTGNLYAYYQIQSTHDVTVNLSVSGALKGVTDNTVTVDWKVSTGSEEDEIIGGTTGTPTYTDKISIFEPSATGSDTVTRAEGSKKISIETADYAGKLIQDYAANINIEVSVSD